MTPKQYRARFEALGFNPSTWGKFVCLSRSTVFRHLKGEIDPIPQIYWRVIEWLEQGKLDNPNDNTGD